MGNRLIFLYHLLLRWGDGERQAIRVLDVPVQARRREEQANPLFCTTLRRYDESFKLAKWLILCFQEKPLSFRQ